MGDAMIIKAVGDLITCLVLAPIAFFIDILKK